MDIETIQMLLDLLQPLDATLDERCGDVPISQEYVGVAIPTREVRDLRRAVLFLEGLRAARLEGR